jgi:hypothetical protein
MGFACDPRVVAQRLRALNPTDPHPREHPSAMPARRLSRVGTGWLARVASWLPWLVMIASAAMPAAASAAVPRNVLVLYSNGRLLPANVEADRAFGEAFAARPDLPVALLAEFLDSPRFAGEAYERAVAAYLRQKYAARPPEVIISGGEESLAFLLRHGQEVFPQIPVLHLAVSSELVAAAGPLPAHFVGIPIEHDFVGTVEQARRLHPQARRLVVVTGSSDWDRHWEARLRSQASELAGGLSVTFLAGLPMAELERRLRALGTDSIVYSPGFFSDGTGAERLPRDAVAQIAAASSAPIYAPYSTLLGTGIVGGRMTGFDAIGQLGANAVLDLLSGVAPASLALPAAMPMSMHVDWRQVRRWGIDPRALPDDAVVHFRTPTFWESYGHWVLVVGVVMLLQAGLIVALLVERRRRRHAGAALARSEQRMSLAARAAQLTMWTLDTAPAPVPSPMHLPT